MSVHRLTSSYSYFLRWMIKLKFQYISYYNYIITYSNNPKVTISFLIKFAADFSSLKIDLESDKYLSDAFNSLLSI